MLLGPYLMAVGLTGAAELDVRAAPGHVRRYSHRPLLAGVSDDLRLPLVLLGVQNLVPDPAPLEHSRKVLGDIDRDGADEYRLALPVALDDVLDDGAVLGLRGPVDEVVPVVPDHRLVRRDRNDPHLVDVHELVGLGSGGAGHARELVVLPEVVLDRDRG